MNPVRRIQGRTVVLPNRDIDTDQIIAARYLTTTTKEGLGQHAFHDLRFDKDGNENPDCILNQPAAVGCSILISGNNFGCGSSREHAPWALLDYGFEAVISTEIADIFCNNSLKNGLVAIVIDAQTHEWLIQNPGSEIGIDIAAGTVTLSGGRSVDFAMDSFARHCLLEGIDQLGFLQQQSAAIEAFEEKRN
ncbi:MAG: 3-isopropylmalate dehydratase small subunit [Woeseiaceae bacterium]|nr:3-isopropylmalate dehydratase small subunit [Woeseiaceae bacterium]